MRLRRYVPLLHSLMRGFRGRCPHCGRGRLFERRFQLSETCPYCQVRFSRARGEMLGAVYLNSFLTLLLALAGFFASEQLWRPPMAVQLIGWTAFALLFALAFFRPARGLWIALAYLTGGVYADPDYEREWINPDRPVVPRHHPHWGE
jgi:uncharacterized protein (DUF983 family)